MKIKLLLYSTSHCHLCELAQELLESTLDSTRFEWEKVDIASSEALVKTYGVRIPVIQDTRNQRELGWPFDQQQLLAFLT